MRNGDARALLSSAVRFKLDERIRDRIIAETRGNPLALLELPRGLTTAQLAGGFGLLGAQALTGRIEESFVRRLETFSHDARRLVLMAAAEPVGDPLPLWCAAERLGIGPAAAEAAEADGLLAIGERVTFRHPLVRSAAAIGSPPPSGLSDEELNVYEQLDFVYKHAAYALMMGSRPQTLTGLADSPVGLAAFLLDHDRDSLALISRAFAGDEGGLTRDDVLDNVTHFWLTNTGVSASRLYASKVTFFAVKNVTVPVGVSVFPDELYRVPRSWAEQAYPNLVYFNEHDVGGHFAAWEQPQLLSEDVRATFRSLR